MNDIIIGKRVTVGAAVGGILATAAYVWGIGHEPIPAEVVIGAGVPITALIQVYIANKFGVTTK